MRLSEKYNFIRTPENYLLTEKSAITFDSPHFSLPSPSKLSTKSLEWSAESRQLLLKVCFFYYFIKILMHFNFH